MGFLLLSAGCAVGLGNVWRFPFIAGQYGGALFVIIYAVFLVIFGIPIMTMEFAVGRASRQGVSRSFHQLEPPGSLWHLFSWAAMAANYLLMMFYTTISGWMLAYVFKTAAGEFSGLSPDGVAGRFAAMTASPWECLLWMGVSCAAGFAICGGGLEKSVEKITKVMMTALFAVLALLVIRAVTLPGAAEGLEFFLKPNLRAVRENGLGTVVYAAMGQAFFTLSLGVGSMAIFGSYIGKERRLFGESLSITALDTMAAMLSGLLIFPACSAFGVHPGQGPTLVFVTLPNVFNAMRLGRLWGTLFFLFMSFAAMSTVVAVFENIVSFAMDGLGWSRRKACAVNFFLLGLLSVPCALGFNAWSGFTPFGAGSNVLDLEDFLVSNTLLPLGSLVYLAFCVWKGGWGWERFLAEADTGRGIRFPARLRPYFRYVLPVLLLFIIVAGYIGKFG